MNLKIYLSLWIVLIFLIGCGKSENIPDKEVSSSQLEALEKEMAQLPQPALSQGIPNPDDEDDILFSQVRTIDPMPWLNPDLKKFRIMQWPVLINAEVTIEWNYLSISGKNHRDYFVNNELTLLLFDGNKELIEKRTIINDGGQSEMDLIELKNISNFDISWLSSHHIYIVFKRPWGDNSLFSTFELIWE